MRHSRVVLLSAALVLSTGCAFTDIKLTLPTEGFDTPLSGGRNRQVIVSTAFADKREIVDRCGMKKNGYNMDTADAVCQGEPDAWVASLFEQELRRAGFDVLEEGDAHRASAVRIDGALLKIFVEPVIGFWSGSIEADLSVRLVATTETGLDAERTFFVKGWRGGQMISITPAYNLALDRATKAMLAEMVEALVELMDRYPQLGFRTSPTLQIALEIGGTMS